MAHLLWEETAKGGLSEDPHGPETGLSGPVSYSLATGTSGLNCSLYLQEPPRQGCGGGGGGGTAQRRKPVNFVLIPRSVIPFQKTCWAILAYWSSGFNTFAKQIVLEQSPSGMMLGSIKSWLKRQTKTPKPKNNPNQNNKNQKDPLLSAWSPASACCWEDEEMWMPSMLPPSCTAGMMVTVEALDFWRSQGQDLVTVFSKLYHSDLALALVTLKSEFPPGLCGARYTALVSMAMEIPHRAFDIE